MEDQESCLRLRVTSCQHVIHDVAERLAREAVHPRIKDQLKRLDQLLRLIDQNEVTDSDLARIERSTSQLMQELSPIFAAQRLGQLYAKRVQ